MSVSDADLMLAVAKKEGLKKQCVAVKIDGEIKDLRSVEIKGSKVEWVMSEDDEGLEIIRHSTAHLLAHAVKQLYPETQVTIGPVIEDGFYYDFYREESFTPEDMVKIDKRMRQLIKKNIPIVRHVISREKGQKIFSEQGEAFKVEIVSDLPDGEDITLYEQSDFIDLCRGPHVPSTSYLGAFKLTKLSGAYWRGDASGQKLQRIYGTAWGSKEALTEYLNNLAEAEKRDHRKLGLSMDLFHFYPESPGMVFWHQRGWTLYKQLEKIMRQHYEDAGYREVNTPQLVNQGLWEQSGHWDKFQENMFTLESDKQNYALKPMNCPCHVLIFKEKLRSYKELPLRIAEFGHVHRYEPSGTLHGLMRVRSFVQDDGHIFCTQEQIHDEVSTFIDQVKELYALFGFHHILIKFSTRPEERVGSDEVWDHSETTLLEVIKAKGIDWELAEGEGAFYGPKLEFSLKDCLNRVWQCGTIQLDFSMPERLGASYVDSMSHKQQPVMLHRAILGSLERFIGILLEQTAGWLPMNIVPVQVVCMNIVDDQADYVSQLHSGLLASKFRAQLDVRSETIGYKIREHTKAKVPYSIICGKEEKLNNTYTLRRHDGKQWTGLVLSELMTKLNTL
ncbi:MAG TPA: threonine--tRNA ligase [Gammaproteobacteria bacterium]|nr:threonine--tRNA ligase [Gammaproteobacteria bacterium]